MKNEYPPSRPLNQIQKLYKHLEELRVRVARLERLLAPKEEAKDPPDTEGG